LAVAAVVQGHMTNEVVAVVVEVLLQRVLML
jgi:hypothetical protein